MLEMTRDVAGRISGLSCRTLLEYVGVNCLRIVAGRACVRQLSTIHGLSSDTSLNFLFGSTIDVQRDRHTSVLQWAVEVECKECTECFGVQARESTSYQLFTEMLTDI